MPLLSLLLTLQPVETSPNDPQRPLPLWWGRAVHALLLDVIRQADDRLAASMHDAPQSPITNHQSAIENHQSAIPNPLRPFTVSTLMGPSTRNGLDANASYHLRLTAFREDVVEHLLAAIQPGGMLSPGSLVELDYVGFQIQSADPPIENPHSDWSAFTSYQDLSAPYLLAKTQAPRSITLKFTSPTVFKSGGMHVPIPLPSLVFGSLLEKWNAFAPIAFPPETKRYAGECLAISRYQLYTRPVPAKNHGLRVGGLGQITYVTLGYDRYWMSLIATLADFALFSGVGAGTTMGLGQGRRIGD